MDRVARNGQWRVIFIGKLAQDNVILFHILYFNQVLIVSILGIKIFTFEQKVLLKLKSKISPNEQTRNN